MAAMRQTDTVDVTGRWNRRLEISAKAARKHDLQALEDILNDVIDGKNATWMKPVGSTRSSGSEEVVPEVPKPTQTSQGSILEMLTRLGQSAQDYYYLHGYGNMYLSLSLLNVHSTYEILNHGSRCDVAFAASVRLA